MHMLARTFVLLTSASFSAPIRHSTSISRCHSHFHFQCHSTPPSPSLHRHAHAATMSFYSPAYLTPAQLHTLLVNTSSSGSSGSNGAASTSRVLVVDVRDEDRYGGHIAGSLHVPSSEFFERTQDIIQHIEAASKEGGQPVDKIVFHCMMSQQRGPKCARIMAEAVAASSSSHSSSPSSTSSSSFPSIHILEGGFSGWVRYLNSLDASVRSKQLPLLLDAYDVSEHGVKL